MTPDPGADALKTPEIIQRAHRKSARDFHRHAAQRMSRPEFEEPRRARFDTGLQAIGPLHGLRDLRGELIETSLARDDRSGIDSAQNAGASPRWEYRWRQAQGLAKDRRRSSEPFGVGGNLNRQGDHPCAVHGPRVLGDPARRLAATANNKGIARIDDGNRCAVALAKAIGLRSRKAANEQQSITGARRRIHGIRPACHKVESDGRVARRRLQCARRAQRGCSASSSSLFFLRRTSAALRRQRFSDRIREVSEAVG
ncbi:hypothetical protein, partial [Bradyrhizobium guangdongense]|uniref:hypothetical protein n=1 Tax=Bradyrhizobium guangdongense TaxID=1325090 RepID=UPI0018F7E0BC